MSFGQSTLFRIYVGTIMRDEYDTLASALKELILQISPIGKKKSLPVMIRHRQNLETWFFRELWKPKAEGGVPKGAS